MNPWHSFLLQHGAHGIDNETPVFAPSGESESLLCHLEHLACLQVKGTDAEKFLQNQLTNDVTKLPDKHWHRSAWCSPKGRVLVVFRVARHHGQEFTLICPRSEAETLAKRLKMFVLRASVEINLLPQAEQPVIGVLGDTAASVLTRLTGSLPKAHANSAFLVHQDAVVLPEIGTAPRYWMFGNREAMQIMWATLLDELPAADALAWKRADIHAGLADIGESSFDQYLPQMINLDELGAIDFDKGCYPGQEIVARTKYLGRLKRRMVRAYADQPFAEGELVFADNDKVGEVLYGLRDGHGQHVSLAVITIDASAQNNLRLASGPVLRTETLVDN